MQDEHGAHWEYASGTDLSANGVVGRQLGADKSEPYRLFVLPRSLAYHSLYRSLFFLSSSLPRGIATHRPGVDCGTEKPVDDSPWKCGRICECLWKRMRTLFIVACFLFRVFFFSPPQSPHEVSCRFHLVFISRHFLAAFKTQSGCVVYVCVLGVRGVNEQNWVLLLLLTQQVLIWLHSGRFVCSTFILAKCRKGRAAPAAMLKGVAEIKGRPLSLFHIFWLVQWAA